MGGVREDLLEGAGAKGEREDPSVVEGGGEKIGQEECRGLGEVRLMVRYQLEFGERLRRR